MFDDRQHTGVLHNIAGKGSNSIVIHAHCRYSDHIYFPEGKGVKVRKLSNSVEKNKAIYKQVHKENEHLKILNRNFYPNNTPYPIVRKKNILIMSFIGINQESAPCISTCPPERFNNAYSEIVKEMDMWYNKLGLIHGSLSTRKILWLGKLYYIGWSHSVKRDHPLALKKLMKDCQFISTFFKSRVVSVKSPEELFKEITGLEKINRKVLEVVHKDLWKDLQASNNPNRIAQECRTTLNCFKR